MCYTQDGAACCIVADEAFVRAHALENQAIELVATGLGTDVPGAFDGRSAMDTVGYGMTRRLADKLFAQAGASRDEVGVVELHDCFAANEVRKLINCSYMATKRSAECSFFSLFFLGSL